MKNFEHLKVEFDKASDLNEYGAQGWELVSTYVLFDDTFAVFKREIGEASEEGLGRADASAGKSPVSVVMSNAGKDHVAVMKVLREILSLSLPEAKKLVTSTPSIIAENAPRAEASAIKQRLAAVGAVVELK